MSLGRNFKYISLKELPSLQQEPALSLDNDDDDDADDDDDNYSGAPAIPQLLLQQLLPLLLLLPRMQKRSG